MFEDFRKQAENASFPEDEEPGQQVSPFAKYHHFLGMTAIQRFIIAFILLLMTVILGTLLLLVSEKIALPFLG